MVKLLSKQECLDMSNILYNIFIKEYPNIEFDVFTRIMTMDNCFIFAQMSDEQLIAVIFTYKTFDVLQQKSMLDIVVYHTTDEKAINIIDAMVCVKDFCIKNGINIMLAYVHNSAYDNILLQAGFKCSKRLYEYKI